MPKYPEFKSKPIIGLPEENWGKLSAGMFNKSINTDWEARTAKIDYKASRAKVDWKASRAKIDEKFIRSKGAANTDYKAISEKKKKPVLQHDLQGNFIKEWDSAVDASIAMGKPGKHDIGAVCRGRQKTAYGFIWRFKQENP